VDSSGNAYITGWTGSTDFPTTAGALDQTYNTGNYDIYIAKLNASGTALVYFHIYRRFRRRHGRRHCHRQQRQCVHRRPDYVD